MNIYTNSHYAFEVAHNFEMRFNLFNTDYKRILKPGCRIIVMQLSVQLAIIKTTGHSKFNTMEAKRNQLADVQPKREL